MEYTGDIALLHLNKNIDMRKVLFLLTLFCAGLINAQTNPASQMLPFSFNTLSASTLPTGMAAHRFGTTTGAIPTTRTTAVATGDLPYATAGNTSGGWRYDAANPNYGISILASGSQSAGAIVVGIITSGKKDITVSWKARTILNQGSYDNSIALQYRDSTVGGTWSTWTDVGTTSTYVTTGTANGDSSTVFTEILPSGANNKPFVQVRWIYWVSAGASGSRDRVGLDEVNITGVCSDLVLAASSQLNLVRQCSNGSIHYYGNGTSNYFGIDTSGVTSGALTGDTASIQVNTTIDSFKSSDGANQEHAMYLLPRYWNAKGSFTGTVKVQFPYAPSDTTTLMSFRDNAWTLLTTVTNTASYAKKNARLEWFKTTGTDYGPSVISAIMGNKFPVSAGITKPSFVYSTSGSTNYVELQGVTSFSGGGAGFSFGPNNGSGGNGLPVTWAGFEVKSTENGNELTWYTGSEQNTRDFEIEYSYDGSNFKTLPVKIKAAGNSADLRKYTYIHADFSTYVYYRIKQNDLDENFDYSLKQLARRTNLKPFQVSVYPVPMINNEINVKIVSIDKSNINIQVTDITGKVIRSSTLVPNSDAIKQDFDMSSLVPGVYFIEVKNAQGTERLKISK
jgi:hypothetical protein